MDTLLLTKILRHVDVLTCRARSSFTTAINRLIQTVSAFSFTMLAIVHDNSIRRHLAGHGGGCRCDVSCPFQLIN
jgi:hypothetical protein